MKKKFDFLGLRPTKQNFAFILTAMTIVGFFALAWGKDVDVSNVIPLILGSYLTARATEKVGSVMAASKQPGADTRAIINDLDGSWKPDRPD